MTELVIFKSLDGAIMIGYDSLLDLFELQPAAPEELEKYVVEREKTRYVDIRDLDRICAQSTNTWLKLWLDEVVCQVKLDQMYISKKRDPMYVAVKIEKLNRQQVCAREAATGFGVFIFKTKEGSLAHSVVELGDDCLFIDFYLMPTREWADILSECLDLVSAPNLRDGMFKFDKLYAYAMNCSSSKSWSSILERNNNVIDSMMFEVEDFTDAACVARIDINQIRQSVVDLRAVMNEEWVIAQNYKYNRSAMLAFASSL